MRYLLLAVVMVTAGCTTPEIQPIAKQSRWFECSGTLQCTILVDDACRVVALNKRFSLDYLEWSRSSGSRGESRTRCREVGQRVASCHNNRCVEGIRFDK